MENSKALSIIQALANGCDPDTGNVLPADDPIQRPEIRSALCHAFDALEVAHLTRHFALWEPPENEWLSAALHKKKPIDRLATSLRRTPIAITAQLKKLGLIP